MMPFEPVTLALLLLWGTVVALDLVSVPQLLLNRPITAAAIAGWIAGDVGAGLRVGVILELFALDVLPVGSARYPDYGPAAVAAAVAAVNRSAWEVGPAILLALLLGSLGARTLPRLRHANARDMRRRLGPDGVADAGALVALQRGSILRDAIRGFGLTVTGLVLAVALREISLPDRAVTLSTAAVVGGGLAAVAGGTLRGVLHDARLRWLAAGLALGTLISLAVAL